MKKNNIFEKVQIKRNGRSNFDLTHDVKLSMKMGQLVPIMCEEVVPGDNFLIGNESLVRFAPLIAPVMHRINVTTHYWYVPNRIIWDNWDKWIIDPKSEAPFPRINVDATEWESSRLYDYVGIPKPDGSKVFEVNALPFAAYQMIYNNFYRDQNLITEVVDKVEDGVNVGLGSMRYRAWMHDYFTSALPFAQKGDSVDVPIVGDSAVSPVKRSDTKAGGDFSSWGVAGGALDVSGKVENDYRLDIGVGELYVENLSGGSAKITDLRRAFKLQEWLELAARGGTRMKEWLLSFFGEKAQDARLQLPEYITGSVTPVTISEIVNTTGEVEGLAQGNMSGHGLAAVYNQSKGYHIPEHGFIIGIMSVMPETAYQQGIEKKFLKFDQFDYFWPQFEHIGEQEIKNVEVYANHVLPELTFGYIPRYSEYKFANNRVAGDFKNTLAHWHFGRIFENSPYLNQDFVEANQVRKDPFAVVDEEEDYLYIHVLNKVKANRQMSYFSNPGF